MLDECAPTFNMITGDLRQDALMGMHSWPLTANMFVIFSVQWLRHAHAAYI